MSPLIVEPLVVVGSRTNNKIGKKLKCGACYRSGK